MKALCIAIVLDIATLIVYPHKKTLVILRAAVHWASKRTYAIQTVVVLYCYCLLSVVRTGTLRCAWLPEVYIIGIQRVELPTKTKQHLKSAAE